LAALFTSRFFASYRGSLRIAVKPGFLATVEVISLVVVVNEVEVVLVVAVRVLITVVAAIDSMLVTANV
jgi:hypothetical protein